MERLIFTAAEKQAKVDKMLEHLLPLRNFAPNNKFNPFRDYPECVDTANIVYVENGNGYGLKPAGSHLRYNYKNNISAVPSTFIVGIFAEILKKFGYEEFKKCFNEYFNDFLVSRVAGNPFEVHRLVTLLVINEECPKLPDISKVMSMKCINTWEANYETWCRPPSKFDYGYGVKKLFAKANNWTVARANRFLDLEVVWDTSKVESAMLLCVATGVHPIALFNFAGLWITHKDYRDQKFNLLNPKTQQYEVELMVDGEIIGYDVDKPQFTNGWFFGFAKLISEINWFGSDGKDKTYVTKEFVHMMQCINIIDFAEMGGPEWQILESVEDCEKACNYYSAMGYNSLNNETIQKELSPSRAKKLAEANKVPKQEITGNPIFDMELLNG